MSPDYLEELRGRAHAVAEAVLPSGDPAAVAALTAVAILGLVQCFWGYRASRTFSFLVGFAVGALIGKAALNAWMPDPSQLVYSAATVGGGLLFGLVFVSLIWIGLFLLGATLAITLTVVATELLDRPIEPNWLILPALIGGGATLAMERSILVATTSLVGAGFTVAAGAELAGARDVARYFAPAAEPVLSNHEILLLGAVTLALAMWGALVQARSTGPDEMRRERMTARA